MKKLTIIAAAFLAMSLASCEKERTCNCTETYDGETETYVYVIEGKKIASKEWCEENVKLISVDGDAVENEDSDSDYSFECELD